MVQLSEPLYYFKFLTVRCNGEELFMSTVDVVDIVYIFRDVALWTLKSRLRAGCIQFDYMRSKHPGTISCANEYSSILVVKWHVMRVVNFCRIAEIFPKA